MNIVERRQFAVEQVQQHESIQHILNIEPTFQNILDLAAHPTPRYNRWVSYEALKRMSQQFVGWGAHHAVLRTSQHWDAMTWAIDLLLPEADEDVLDESLYEKTWQHAIDSFEQDRDSDWSHLPLLESGE
jgi:hypothetical protein